MHLALELLSRGSVYRQTPSFLNQTLHFNGRKWSHVSAPNPGGTASSAFNTLEGVSCISPSDCWAAGDMETSAYFNVVLHWNGKKWSRTKTPQPGGSSGSNLNSISCASASSCVAAGDFNTTAGAVLNDALSWNGKRWVRAITPQPGGTSVGSATEPYGVQCASDSVCWAVGTVSSGSALLNLALHWNGKEWADH